MDSFNKGLLSLMSQPAFQIGTGLLGRTHLPFGQALGGTMNDMNAYQAQQQRQKVLQEEMRLRQQKLQSELDQQAKTTAAREAYAKQNPQHAALMAAYPNAAPALVGSMFRKPPDAPSNVREWQYFQSLTQEQKKQYLAMKRASQVVDRGSEYFVMNPMDPTTPSATIPKDLAPKDTPATKGQQAQATAVGTASGKAQAEAVMGLDSAVSEAQNAITVIDQMMGHPGLDYAVGASSVLPIIPGTPAADFDALAKQLEGKAFLQAFETLKGGGQITEVEGNKAQAAIARLSRAQTEQEYRASLREFKNIIQRGVARARSKAKRAASGPQSGSGEFSGFSIVED